MSIIILIGLIYSCESDKRQHENKTIFRYNEASGLANLDPAFARDQAHIWVCNQLFNSLVQLDDNLEIKSSIAKYWDVSDDGTKYIFHLRDDIFFHESAVFEYNKRKGIVEAFVYIV